MLIAYRDHVKDGTVIDLVEGFFATMPVTNLQTRSLAIRARTDPFGSPGNIGLQATFSENKPIGVVAILAHNMDASTQSLVELQTFNGASWDPVFSAFFDVWLPPADTLFQRHHIIVLPQEVQARRIIYTNNAAATIDGEPWTAGRFWAGPVWGPEGKTAQRDFRMQSRDDSIVLRSIAQQTYVDYRSRYRQLTCTIPYLTEEEAIGTEDGDVQNLQDIGFEVGRGGEVIVIPSVEGGEQVIHKFGLYGHFAEVPSVALMDANPEKGRLYTSTFDVVEDL